jgi:hypothetical protein
LSPSPFEAEQRVASPRRPANSEKPELPEVVWETSEVPQSLQPITEKEMRQVDDVELCKMNHELREHIQHLKAEVERRRREQVASAPPPKPAKK